MPSRFFASRRAAGAAGGADGASAAAQAPPPPPSPTRHLLPPPTAQPPWQRVRRVLAPDSLGYVHGVLGSAEGAALGLGPSARPSSLQPLLKRGRLGPADLCRPCLTLSATSLSDLPLDRAGRLAPLNAGVASCSIALGPSVKGVPHAGSAERPPRLHTLRACLYDGARFHGCTQELRPRTVKAGRRGDTWRFDSGTHLIVRCPAELLPRAQLYVELNASFPLAPDELARLPAKPERAARQADEICLAWALLDLSTLRTLHTPRSISLPLRVGPLAARMTLGECAAATAATDPAAAAAGAAEAASCGAPSWSLLGKAGLAVRLAPLPAAEAATASLLPAAAVVTLPLAKAVSCYRQLLAEALATAEGPASLAPARGDAVLAGFPAVLGDADLAAAFMSLWEKALAPRKGKRAPPPPSTPAQLAAAFRQCATAVWALLGAQAVPPASIANNVGHQAERCRRIQLFLQQHPAVGLGGGAAAWLHKPFDASELRAGPLEHLGVAV